MQSLISCSPTQPNCPQTSLQKDEPKEKVSLLIEFLYVELQIDAALEDMNFRSAKFTLKASGM